MHYFETKGHRGRRSGHATNAQQLLGEHRLSTVVCMHQAGHLSDTLWVNAPTPIWGDVSSQSHSDRGRPRGSKLKEIQQRLSAEGRDPAAPPEARARLGASIARRQAERRAWEFEHPQRPDLEA